MIDKIDITMTGVIRPDILTKTLESIVKNICQERDGFRLIMNIDPIGEPIKPAKVVKVAQRYFDDIVYNIPKTPSFAKAVKWVWQTATAPYILANQSTN